MTQISSVRNGSPKKHAWWQFSKFLWFLGCFVYIILRYLALPCATLSCITSHHIRLYIYSMTSHQLAAHRIAFDSIRSHDVIALCLVTWHCISTHTHTHQHTHIHIDSHFLAWPVPLVVGVSLPNFEEQLKHAESSAKALEERPSGSRDLRIRNIKGGFNPHEWGW